MIRPIPEAVALREGGVALASLASAHVPDLVAMVNDPRTMEYMSAMANPDGWTVEGFGRVIDAWKHKQKLQLGIYLAVVDPSGRAMGWCTLTKVNAINRCGEFGLVLHHSYWRKGVTPACYLMMLEFAFTVLDFHRIEFVTLEENVRARGLLEKIGIVCEGVRQDAAFEDGRFKNDVAYRMLAPEWPTMRARLRSLLG